MTLKREWLIPPEPALTAAEIQMTQAAMAAQIQAMRNDISKRMLDAFVGTYFTYTVDGEPAIDTLPEHTHEHAQPAESILGRAAAATVPRVVANAGVEYVADHSGPGGYVVLPASTNYGPTRASDCPHPAAIDELPRQFRAAEPGEPATSSGYVGRADDRAAAAEQSYRDAPTVGTGIVHNTDIFRINGA